MDKNFDAKAAEPRIYAKWEEDGCFKAGVGARRPETFCIVIPPPNVTGSLHMGHALNNTLQDILIRFKRMQGFDTLWQPGTDHAGIATQMVVERELMETQQPSRREMGREKFVDRVWEQKEKSEGTILGQLKHLGASCDWSRNEFTMSEGLSAAVLKVFVDLYNQGLIYKSKRLVNWDPKFETAISDLEVENTEVDGHMWHFKYPLQDGATYEYVEKDEDGNVTLRETRDYISIATTRPETMLGDGAVAVHPSDERYAPIVGKLCEIPVGPKEHRRLIPIITDDYPDPDFGSGAVKITGAHDFNDYAVAQRGNIPMYRLMDTKGHMRDDGAPYVEDAAKAQSIIDGAEMTVNEIDLINIVPDDLRGLDRFEARKHVIDQITAEGLAVTVPADHPDVAWMKGQAPEWDNLGRARFPEIDDDESRVGLNPTLPLVESKKIMQPFGDRSKVVIEPMLTDQWFVDAKTLAAPALKAVQDGTTKLIPENADKTYYNWLEDIQPWCISRQLWWGHQIPVWYGPGVKKVADSGAGIMGKDPIHEVDYASDKLVSFCAANEADALAEAMTYYRQFGEGLDYEVCEDAREAFKRNDDEDGECIAIFRDPDVLDTWFSSALWPFSTLGWPDKTLELDRYYKTDVLITGLDIIFFWVARMMMQGIHFMEEVPFHTVYFNSIVVDKNGKKMSKSLGNIIDPLIMIDEFGADATRYALASQEAQNRRLLRMSNQAAEGGQRFGTKLWNAARFAEINECYGDSASAQMAHGSGTDGIRMAYGWHTPGSQRQTVNKWIVGETGRAVVRVTNALEEHKFNEACSAIYDHVWKVFCDWYVEFSKPLLTGEDPDAKAETRATMAWALDQCLILLHPIMPFITEELWQNLASRKNALMLEAWPSDDIPADAAADAEMDWVIRVIDGIRSVRAEMNVPAAAKIEMVLTGYAPEIGERLLRNSQLIQRLARLSEVAVAEEAPEGCVTIALTECAVNLPLKDVIDIGAESARLKKAFEKVGKEIMGLEKKLSNQGFLAKAPEEVVEEQRDRLNSAQSEAAKLNAAVERLAAMG
ncbi:MAG: valine--tRNA ligase [Pseudomonadota bacterium]